MTPKILLPCLLLAASNLFAQTSKKVITNGSTRFEIQQNDSTGRPNYIIRERPQTSGGEPIERRLIVRLKNEPLAKLQHLKVQNNDQTLDNEHRLFKDDFVKIHKSNTSAKASRSPRILHEFKNTYNGFAVLTDSEGEKKIKLLRYVASVTEDKKIEAIDLTGHEVIGADQVWQNYNITGKGVVIGIIDTGIDYTHPDLGGAMGSNNKVIGGYDFVNEDADPMDDHGHGTHVAGIAAANGTIKGVAPDAKLMGFKVLSAEGWGYDSWILAAIERTVDPDQNPATDDAVDIANMSLGRYADPSEPFSEAIANATLQGVTFVVAAGNSYDYQTVGTPGVAEDAITVAATDFYDYTAYFSSKGPTENDYRIKPDVAAPGVDIHSCFLNGQYQTWSGTSMASPHVAGATALLLEKHPDWTPQMVKAALMNNSKKSWESLWNQGAGRIDVLNSIKTEFIVTPGSISLGLLDSTEPQIKNFTITIKNISAETKNFNTALPDLSVAGISIDISPSNISIGAGQSADISISMTINPSELQYKNFLEGYFGSIKVTSGVKEVALPVAFIHSPLATFNYTGETPSVSIIFNNTGTNFYWKPFYPTSDKLQVMLPSGNYDCVHLYNDNLHIVINESIEGSANNTIPVDKAMANNLVLFKPKDENNQSLKGNYDNGFVVFNGLNKNIITFYPYYVDSIYISSTESYGLNFKYRKQQPYKFYDISGSSGFGVQQSSTLTNDGFAQLSINDGENVNKWATVWNHATIGPGFWMSLYNTYPFEYPVDFKILQSQDAAQSIFKSALLLHTSPDPSTVKWRTCQFASYEGDSITFYNHWDNYLTSFHTKELNFTLGKTLMLWNGIMYKDTPNHLYIYDNMSWAGVFKYNSGESKPKTMSYELLSNENMIASGTFDWWLSLDIPDGPSKVKVHYNGNRVGNIEGDVTTELSFNIQNYDYMPPIMNWFTLEQNNIQTNQISKGDNALIAFEVANYDNSQKSAKLMVKSTSSDWIDLNLTQYKPGVYSASVPASLDEGYYDLKLIVTDYSDNVLTHELSPGFLIGPADVAYDKVNLITPVNHAQNSTALPAFSWSSLPSVISYTLQISTSSSFGVVDSEVNVNSTAYVLPSLLQFNTTYYWRVRPEFEGGPGAWSDVFDFKTTKLQTSLQAPDNHNQGVLLSPTYTWDAHINANTYTLQLSKQNNFASIVKEVTVSETNYAYPSQLQYNTTYYWRVRPNAGNTHGTWSEVFDFKTIDPSQNLFINLILPENNSAGNSPVEIPFEWTAIPNAMYYIIEFSENYNFSTLNRVETALLNSTQLTDFQPLLIYFWRVGAQLPGGAQVWSTPYVFATDGITGADPLAENAKAAYAYPNPFSTHTSVVFHLPKPSTVLFELVDVNGQEINRMYKVFGQEGTQTVILQNSDFTLSNKRTGGLYFCKIITGSTMEVVKIVLHE